MSSQDRHIEIFTDSISPHFFFSIYYFFFCVYSTFVVIGMGFNTLLYRYYHSRSLHFDKCVFGYCRSHIGWCYQHAAHARGCMFVDNFFSIFSIENSMQTIHVFVFANDWYSKYLIFFMLPASGTLAFRFDRTFCYSRWTRRYS